MVDYQPTMIKSVASGNIPIIKDAAIGAAKGCEYLGDSGGFIYH